MREIIFRGKNNKGVWCYGNLILRKDGTYLISPDETPLGHYGAVYKESVGQYTGLKDWDEKEVFEGDIIQYLYDGYDENDQYIVEWDEENLQYSFKNTRKSEYMALEDMYDCEYGKYSIRVIGNIYDNPDLIRE